MYYIVNHTQHIISADSSLLKLLFVDSIDALYAKIAVGDITFTSSDEKVTITIGNNSTSYQAQNHILYGILGDITLVQLHLSEEENLSVSDDEPFDLISDVKEREEKIDDKISFDDKLFDLMSDVEEREEKIEDKISFDDKPFDLVSDVEEREERIEDKISFDDKPFDLVSDADKVIVEENVVEKPLDEEATTTELIVDDTSPIIVDIESISQDIGISTNDYNNFLNEYIDTALTLEEDLKSTEKGKHINAISTLSHLANVLHLPVITNIIKQIRNASPEDQNSLIKSLYATLARLNTTQIETIEAVQPPATEKKLSAESFGTIDLDDVKPIHFDFQMEAAANDLSLPVELIEEFVNDFIAQAHEETEKMLEFYEKGDLDAIQKIGHLLKGTASNLRINPLADTLYEIQFCDDSSKLEQLIKEYWGHFLSFETQINFTTK